jgi:hypothetical protein
MKCGPTSIPSRITQLCFLSLFSFGMFLLSASPDLSAQSVFTGPLDYVIGAQPNSMIVADLNGDGLLDLATADSYGNSVTVVLQNSDGTFQAPVSYAVGNSPATLQVADVNQDGKPDLLVVNLSDNTFSVLLGNGDGTFQAQIVTTIIGPIANATCCLAVADFNGDGKPDVAAPVPVITTQGAYGVAILLGNGDGTFQTPVVYPTTAASDAIAAADFNNDGKLDIAAGNSILLGNGDGTFQAPISVPLSGPLVVADFNQDGNLDIATSGVTILYGNGDGTFQVQTLSLSGTPLAAGDLNGDGKPDLIAAVSGVAPSIESLLNNGTSTFSLAQSLESGYSTAALASFKNGQPPNLLIAGGGGSPGVPGIVTILSGNGDGTFTTFPSYSAGSGTDLGTMAVADFNGDGKPDLALGLSVEGKDDNYTAEVGVFLNNGAGFSPPIITTLQGGAAAVYPVTADFNGDGKMDLAVGGAILLGNGDGTFQPEVDYGGIGALAAGDFNNDGKTDLLGLGSTGGLAIILGNGNGTFGLALNSPVGGYSAYAQALAVADFNGDGKLDVAAVVTDSLNPPPAVVQIMTGNGDGTFSIGSTYNLAVYPSAIATGDLNGDGIPDIVVGLPYYNDYGVVPSSIAVFLGNGDGTFQNPITTVAGNGIGSIVISDINLDGKQDVAFTNSGWNDVSLLLGNGDGTFQAPVQFSGVGADFTGEPFALADALAVGDFDGNGSPDIAAENSGGIYLLLSAGKNGSAALVSPASLVFGNQNVGQASTVQAVVLSNTNSAALSVTGISISGSQSGDYQQANNCGTSLAAGANCVISVTFSPQAVGVGTALIQITDSAFNSPQTISLSGTGIAAPDFTFGTASGGSSSSTISAGGTAKFGLALTPVGSFSGTVTLACSVMPAVTPAPICSVPGSVSVSGSAATAVTVTVTTTAAGSTIPRPFDDLHPTLWLMGWTLALGASGLLLLGRKRRLALAPMFVLALLVTSSGCGGGGSSPTITAKGTPGGTYTATVMATSGSLSHQAALTVIVQ